MAIFEKIFDHRKISMENLSFKELLAHKKAFELAMEIFNLSKLFPSEEKFSLISQIRRSSRSVCSNIAEGYRKRLYRAHFISKISDAYMENSETQVWLDFSLKCEYCDKKIYEELTAKSYEIGRLLNYMMKNPEKYLRQDEKYSNE